MGADHLNEAASAAASLLDELGLGLRAFGEDMRARGIHVGLGGFCVVCDQAWPCDTITDDGTAAGPDRFNIAEALEEAVRLGWMEVVDDGAEGRPTYRMTLAGEAMVEAMPNEGS